MKWRSKKAVYEDWLLQLKSGHVVSTKEFAWRPIVINGTCVWLERYYVHHTWHKPIAGNGWWYTIESLSEKP